MSDDRDVRQTEVTEQQIREIARRIGRPPGVVGVWLLCSHATGTAGPDTDDGPPLEEPRGPDA